MSKHEAPLAAFREHVALKYQLYNALFQTLPFPGMAEIGTHLPIFADLCRKQLAEGASPVDIVNSFFSDVYKVDSEKERMDVFFQFLQLVERQIVLFDALEDAAFSHTHDLLGAGSLSHFLNHVCDEHLEEQTRKYLKEFCVRLVLTAHPTQFYPESILDLITDLSSAVKENDISSISSLLYQMGKTSFKNQTSPTPLSEANNLIRRCETSIYPAMLEIQSRIIDTLYPKGILPKQTNIELGFWPGGDRDGHPFVTVETTLEVSRRLKASILKQYSRDFEKLRRRLTFKGIVEHVQRIDERLHQANQYYSCPEEFEADLRFLREELITQHDSLFIEQVDRLILAVQMFGFHFAALDIRQDSRIHSATIEALLSLYADQFTVDVSHYATMTGDEKLSLLQELLASSLPKIEAMPSDPLHIDVVQSLQVIAAIQQSNGSRALHRYIISNAQEAYQIGELFFLARWIAWPTGIMPLDIVPLFETVADLAKAEETMNTIYEMPCYFSHLTARLKKQTVMLGFSDGTKDGGYITCNWSIFLCKQRLSELSKKYELDITYFDGRGGPPARGGGRTHRFYRALAYHISQKEIHLTIQGQTISSNFGTADSALFNIEQLLTAGLEGELFPHPGERFQEKETELLNELSRLSHESYLAFKNDPCFIKYLEELTPLNDYGHLNIASRPPKRKNNKKLILEDLRAISFVGAWSQMKQNIPGYYGLGTAIEALIEQGHQEQLSILYHDNLFFHTLIDNAMQSLEKSFLELTQYIESDPQFARFWRLIRDESKRTRKMILIITNMDKLLADDQEIQHSIALRETLILPLLVIQHYALIRRRAESDQSLVALYEKLVLKSLPPNINASRNSA